MTISSSLVLFDPRLPDFVDLVDLEDLEDFVDLEEDVFDDLEEVDFEDLEEVDLADLVAFFDPSLDALVSPFLPFFAFFAGADVSLDSPGACAYTDCV